MSVGAVLQASAFSVPHMIVGRYVIAFYLVSAMLHVRDSIVGGIGNGINTSIAPVWQGETSKASWRGKLIVIEMILNIAGFSFSNWVTYAMSFAGGSVSWRFPIALQFTFILILFGTVPWLPESPRCVPASSSLPIRLPFPYTGG